MSKKHKHKQGGKKVAQHGQWMLPTLLGVAGDPVLSHEKCWHNHPVLQLGGGVFHGASCIYPHNGYDIYVGLDWGMHRRTVYPWHPAPESAPIEVYFPIKDGGVPSNRKEFDAMLDWLVGQLAQGRKVHAGCIGGHGRTGLLLAALVCRINGAQGAGAWVREHYCKQAVETTEQVDWLCAHFGMDKIVSSRKLWGGAYVPTKAADKPMVSRYTPQTGRAIWGDLVSRYT